MAQSRSTIPRTPGRAVNNPPASGCRASGVRRFRRSDVMNSVSSAAPPNAAFDGFSPLMHATAEGQYDFNLVDWSEWPQNISLRYGDPDASSGSWIWEPLREQPGGEITRSRAEMDLTEMGWFTAAPIWNMYWTQL